MLAQDGVTDCPFAEWLARRSVSDVLSQGRVVNAIRATGYRGT